MVPSYGKPFLLLFILGIWILDINQYILLDKMLILDIRNYISTRKKI